MASTQDLNRRITSVGNTRKITRAMEMVAAAKLRRAQDRIFTLRPFSQALSELTARVAVNVKGAAAHPLLAARDVERVCIVMYTGDRGLAGALNANILRRSLELKAEWEEQGAEVHFIGVGRRGGASLKFRGIDLDAEYTGITDSPKFRDAEEIASAVIDRFTGSGDDDEKARAARYDRVVLVYNHFDSAISQTVIVQDLLPLTDEVLSDSIGDVDGDGDVDADDTKAAHSSYFEFEPSEEDLLDRLLPTYVEQSCYRALLESTASEHGARMTAMRNATDNAGELLDALTLQRNRARQAAITQEILEIVGGADAL